MLWALVLMQEVLCAQEEEAPPKKNRRHTHDPVSEESTWEPPSPNFWEKSWKARWQDPKSQTWELLSL